MKFQPLSFCLYAPQQPVVEKGDKEVGAVPILRTPLPAYLCIFLYKAGFLCAGIAIGSPQRSIDVRQLVLPTADRIHSRLL